MATNLKGISSKPNLAAVDGENTGGGDGVAGTSGASNGVHGKSTSGFGVFGESTSGRGVVAVSVSDYGLRAGSQTSSAIRASSAEGVGLEARGGTNGGGTVGTTDGIVGTSPTGNGVRGEAESSAAGVQGVSRSGSGVSGQGKTGGTFDGAFEGVHAVSHDPAAAGVAGYNDNSGPGVYGKSTHGAAGVFEGNVLVTGNIQVNGDIQLHGGADVAEHFDVAGAIEVEPGTVMVLDGDDRVRVSESAYDRKVVGVVAGAGGYRPGVILDHHAGRTGRQPLALVGKACCKVDASFGAVQLGDLLTTAPTSGHAMKASEPDRAFGAVLGKAMAPLSEGCALLPILVTLQ